MSKAGLSPLQITELKTKARMNLVAYRHLLLDCGKDEVMPAEYHYDWSYDLLEDKSHQAKQGFRESAKTQYVLRAFMLYALTFPARERDYIVIVKKNATLARNKLKEIEQEYKSNPIISANREEILEESGEVFSVNAIDDNGDRINVRIETYGKGASIRGLSNLDRRPKIVIIDDPQDLEDAESETVQATDWTWFLSDVMFLGQHTRIFLIGNNLGEKCILERVFTNAPQLGFKIERVSILNKENKSNWPAKYSYEQITKEKEAFREMGKLDVWLRERMCEAVGIETRIFNPQDYRYFTAATVDKVIQRCNLFATLDPASSADIKSCYRAIVVNAVNEDNYWNIVDVPYGRWDSSEMIDKIFDTVTYWKLKDFGIEKGIFKQLLEPFIYKEMSKRNVFFNIIPIEHAKQGSKLERIKMLQPRFKAHTIWFPEGASWLTELEGELAGITKDAIKSLYTDLIDALAMQEQIARAPFNAMNSQRLSSLPRQSESEYPVFTH